MKIFFNSAIKSYVMIGTGCFIMTVAMNMFLIPYKLAPGGVSGLSTVIFYMIKGLIPVGMLMLIFNIPLFLLGYKSRGKQFLIRSLFGAVLLSLLIDVTAPLFNWLIDEYFVKFDNAMATPDLLLNALLGGLILGFGLGMVFKEEATTGGTDLASALFKKIFPSSSIPRYLLVVQKDVPRTKNSITN